METHRKERLAGLAFATHCLRDDVGRLERLSSQLSDKSHSEECSEIARNISAQLEVVSLEIAELHTEMVNAVVSSLPQT